MGWVKVTQLDEFGDVTEIRFDSRFFDLESKAHRDIISKLNEIIKTTRRRDERLEALAERERLLQAWTGYPPLEFADDDVYDKNIHQNLKF